ncbi:MAG: phosphodiester glycosidase family protein [Armatimonadetes bacterium]|nr:phosphodiester glycosidase family protein [Armatimonadota bacterium]
MMSPRRQPECEGTLSRRGAAARRRWLLVAITGMGAAVSVGLAGCLTRPAEGQDPAPGLSYRRLEIAASAEGDAAELHALRVDPARYRIRLVTAGAGDTATARRLAVSSGALAVINGGFFDEDFRPLGLRVARGRRLRPLRRADWGVFLIRDGHPEIVHTRDYRPEGVSEALQCGPRLVVRGEITRLKQQSAQRACVGIDRQGRVVLAVTRGHDVDATYLARALRRPEEEGGLGCRDALNLDGGPSAQMFVSVGRFRLDLPGTWGVPDGLGVFPR